MYWSMKTNRGLRSVEESVNSDNPVKMTVCDWAENNRKVNLHSPVDTYSQSGHKQLMVEAWTELLD
ncbi:hypothetical protein KTT_14580 [Tengunoibacter tsumagoiensis]|uniref:Uncharacterized protein n=1 Tax=Tengunoibacter tsumagoiensis TaxID=2014871 RepID=A0A401ZXM8_9CHLR|nr:hypothetical protein KTT_14580 [Tengunoibacter tsumagoiensis]